MESQARSHDPQAHLKPAAASAAKTAKNATSRASPRPPAMTANRTYKSPDNRQNRRVECALAVVSDYMGKEAYDRRGKTADY